MRATLGTVAAAGLLFSVFLALGACQWLKFCAPQRALGSDFFIYGIALDKAWKGQDPYLPHSIGWGYLYPPPSLLLLKAAAGLSLFGVRPAVVFITLSVVAVGLGLAMLGGTLSWRGIYLSLLLLTSAGLIETVCVGQINGIVVVLLASFFWAWRRQCHWLACAALATAVALKATPVALVAFYATRKGWKWVLRLAAIVMMWFLLAEILIPAGHLTSSFVDALRWASDQPVNDSAAAMLNYSLSASISRFLHARFHSVMPRTWTVVHRGKLLLLALLLGATYLRYRRRPVVAANALFVSCSTCMVLAPNIVWLHHATLLIPAFFVLLAEPNNWVAFATALLALLCLQSTRCLEFYLQVHPALPSGIGQVLLLAASAIYMVADAGPITDRNREAV